METLKVSTRSNPNSVAGAMAGVLRQEGAVEVQVVGAGALNQAIKAVAIARGYVAATGIDVVCVPTFADVEIDGEQRTAIRLNIEDRTHRGSGEPHHAAHQADGDGVHRVQHGTLNEAAAGVTIDLRDEPTPRVRPPKPLPPFVSAGGPPDPDEPRHDENLGEHRAGDHQDQRAAPLLPAAAGAARLLR